MKIQIHEIIRSDRKSLALTIDLKGRLIIRAPRRLPKSEIDSFVKSREKWIIRHRQRMIENYTPVALKKYIDGEKFLLFGNEYPLSIIECSKMMVVNDKIIMPQRFNDNFRSAMVRFYKDNLKLYASHRVEEIAKENSLNFSKLKITSAQKRWGSCNSKGNINLTYKLCMAPKRIIDYVLIHELCHTQHLNHSHNFWQLVDSIMPDYKTYQNWLRDYGQKLVL